MQSVWTIQQRHEWRGTRYEDGDVKGAYLMGMTPNVEFTRPDALWDMEGVEQQSNHVSNHAQTEGS
jgi:hypothetical protein